MLYGVCERMNPAEEIVKFWLQMKGYFLQSSIRLRQNKEIDILAIHPKTNERLHIEVSVSVRMANFHDNASVMARKFYESKFLAIVDDVKSRLGDSHKIELVVGKVLLGNRDIREEFIIECEKLGIRVLKFEEILNEVASCLSTHSHLNSSIKAVQLSSVFMNCN